MNAERVIVSRGAEKSAPFSSLFHPAKRKVGNCRCPAYTRKNIFFFKPYSYKPRGEMM
jgi:hypothetical protein